MESSPGFEPGRRASDARVWIHQNEDQNGSTVGLLARNRTWTFGIANQSLENHQGKEMASSLGIEPRQPAS